MFKSATTITSLIRTTRRGIGFLDLNKPLNIEPHAYDSLKTPALFTELQPTKDFFDEEGNPVNELERSIDTLHRELTTVKQERKLIKPQVQIEGQFRLDREIYKSILNKHKNGDVAYVRTQTDKSVVFFGADYENINIKNLYKAMTVAKPDLVLVQIPPHYILDNFSQHPTRFADSKWVFDSLNYLKQIERPGHELYPSLQSKLNLQKSLKQNRMIVATKTKVDFDANEEIVQF